MVVVALKITACGGRNARLKVTDCVANDGAVLLSSPEKVDELLGRRRRWWWCSWGMLLIVGDGDSTSRREEIKKERERELFGSATDSRERKGKMTVERENEGEPVRGAGAREQNVQNFCMKFLVFPVFFYPFFPVFFSFPCAPLLVVFYSRLQRLPLH